MMTVPEEFKERIEMTSTLLSGLEEATRCSFLCAILDRCAEDSKHPPIKIAYSTASMLLRGILQLLHQLQMMQQIATQQADEAKAEGRQQ